MKIASLLFLALLPATSQASVIAGGQISIFSDSIAGTGWTMNLTGPGLNIFANENLLGGVATLPPLCTSLTCTYSFSQVLTLNSVHTFSNMVDGVTYNFSLARISLTVTSSVQSAGVVCNPCAPGGPAPVSYFANWAPTSFSVSGVISLFDTTQPGSPQVYSGILTGGGSAGAGSTNSIASYANQNVSFTFTPEPAAAAQMLAGLSTLAAGTLVAARRRKRQ